MRMNFATDEWEDFGNTFVSILVIGRVRGILSQVTQLFVELEVQVPTSKSFQVISFSHSHNQGIIIRIGRLILFSLFYFFSPELIRLISIIKIERQIFISLQHLIIAMLFFVFVQKLMKMLGVDNQLILGTPDTADSERCNERNPENHHYLIVYMLLGSIIMKHRKYIQTVIILVDLGLFCRFSLKRKRHLLRLSYELNQRRNISPRIHPYIFLLY